MLALLVFSVGSWSIIIMKFLMFRKLQQNSDEFLDRFWESKTLNEAYDSARDYTESPEAALFVSGFHELKKISTAREGQDKESDSWICTWPPWTTSSGPCARPSSWSPTG